MSILYSGRPEFTITKEDFNQGIRRLEALVFDDHIRTGLVQLFNERIFHLIDDARPLVVKVYSCCRLKADLFGRCTGSFRGVPRFDRISVKGKRSSGRRGEPYFSELMCLCSLLWPNKEIENVAVVHWFEDVSTIRDWVDEEHSRTDGDLARDDVLELETTHRPLFDRLDVNVIGQKKLTDGHHRLNRRYVTWQVDIEAVQCYDVINIDRLYKPEHLIRDRKLMDDEGLQSVPAWYVQDTRTYYTNLPKKMI